MNLTMSSNNRISSGSKWGGAIVLAGVFFLTALVAGCSTRIDRAQIDRAHTLGADVTSPRTNSTVFSSAYPLGEKELRKIVMDVCRDHAVGDPSVEMVTPSRYTGWWFIKDSREDAQRQDVYLGVSTGVTANREACVVIQNDEKRGQWTPHECDIALSLLEEIQHRIMAAFSVQGHRWK